MERAQSDRSATAIPDLPVDVFNSPEASLEVVILANQGYAEDSDCGSHRPHRHAYHELIWSRRGVGSHLIDGQRSLVEPRLVTVIGRGQVHVFEHGVGLDGAIVRFGDEMLQVEAMARANPAWLVGFQGPHSVFVPDDAAPHLDALVVALAEEVRLPVDSRSRDVQRHLLCTMLLWVERWHDGSRNGTEIPFEVGGSLLKGWNFRTIVQGSSVPQQMVPRLIEMWRQGMFPIDKLVKTYDFADINTAFADSQSGAVVKPVLVL